MILLDFLVLALATFRLSSLIASENGPFDILLRLRIMLGMNYDSHGTPYANNGFIEGFMCMWCNSVWIGLGVAVGFYFAPGVVFWALMPFALSSVAVLAKT